MLGLLFGLLGMHGLGSAQVSVEPAGHHQAVETSAHLGMDADSAPDVASMAAPTVCDHDGGGCGGGGHVQHADPACSSSGVSGAPALPTLPPAVADCVAPSPVHAAWNGSSLDGGRAPPSLSELQLLRI
nr:DUF6153 family protein [Streptomyces sp. BA2]